MLCDVCGKNLATVHLTEIVNGDIQETHICKECAKIRSNSNVDNQFNIADLLSELISGEEVKEKIPIVKLACSNCGLSYRSFKKNGKFGCLQCYSAFRSQINNILRKIHGSVSHKGKIPEIKIKNEINLNKKLYDLKEYLVRAIELEEYEQAARIRDELKSLQLKLKKIEK